MKAHLDLNLQISQKFLGLCSLPVSMVQLHLHLIQVALHLLPQAHRLVARLSLCIQGGLHGFKGSLMVTTATRDERKIQRSVFYMKRLRCNNTSVKIQDIHRIPPKVVEFLIFLCQLPVNVGLHLVQLQLDAQSFAFFMLQSALRQTDGPWSNICPRSK